MGRQCSESWQSTKRFEDEGRAQVEAEAERWAQRTARIAAVAASEGAQTARGELELREGKVGDT